MSARASRAPAPSSTREPRARHPRRALEVENAERRAELPVRLRREVERRRRAPLRDFGVVGRRLPRRHALVRQVRQRQQQRVALRARRRRAPLRARGSSAPRALFSAKIAARVASLLLRARDRLAGGVLIALQVLDQRNQPPPLRLERRPARPRSLRRIETARAQTRLRPRRDDRDVQPGSSMAHAIQRRPTAIRCRGSVTRVRKAVFPAAGLGTRFLPATKAQPKEMLPLVDKPIIQYGVEEAVASGVDDIILVTGRGKNAIEDHFDVSIELETFLEARGKTRAARARSARSRAWSNVAYVRQGEPLGLGHAVLVTRPLVGNEPFAVILADDVIDAQPPALAQMIDVFNEVGGPVILVERVPEAQISELRRHRRGAGPARASTGSPTWSRSRPPARRRQTSRSSAATCSRPTSSRCSRRPRASEAPARSS